MTLQFGLRPVDDAYGAFQARRSQFLDHTLPAITQGQEKGVQPRVMAQPFIAPGM